MVISKTIRCLRAGILAGAGILGTSTSALADVKAYHGAFCQGLIASQREVAFYTNSGIKNDSSIVTLQVICPMIRDRTGSSTNIDSAAIEFHNQTGTFSCSLVSQTEDTGGSVLDFHTKSTSATGDLQLDSFSVDTTSGNEGTYDFECQMGAGDVIYHYQANEENSAD